MIDYEWHDDVLAEWEAHLVGQQLVNAALEGDEPLYREADDCGFVTAHSIGEHGKPCQDCGAERMWVLPATKEKQ